jgi:hypothetical protein
MKKILLVSFIAIMAFIQMARAQSECGLSLNKVLASYYDLKNGLFTDDAVKARAAAKELYDAIENVPDDQLSADQRKTWLQYEKKLSYDAEHIKQTDEIEHQREHFTNLSLNMYKTMKALNVSTADIYYQYCPMANDYKGAYWLNEKSTINNPYMGKKMPSCGSNKETIKAKS